MNIICKIRGHKWKEGYCSRCGREHDHHEFIPQPGICVEKCVVCNMSREINHNFSQRGPCEYVCTNCGKRITKHTFVPKNGCTYVCANCGVERTEHKWNTVKKRGEMVPGCKCTVCGEINPTGEHTPDVRRNADGALYLVCTTCGTVIKRLSPEEAAQFSHRNAHKPE